MPEWLVPAGLILLGVVPAVAGGARVAQLLAGADITPENARFFATPLPVLLHIPAAVVYSLLGAFQFAPGFRRRRRGWHRAAGRVLIPCALVVAISGLWMTLSYPWPEGDGAIVFVERLVFGSAMLVAVIVGIDALRRRAFGSHGAWMVRAYAIGLGAGTQVLTHLPWFVLAEGRPGEGPRALMMGAGWVINLAVAEWILRRPAPVPTPSPHSPAEARRTAFTFHRIRTCSSSH
jgi:uncharacterized membrane protein